jgi:hypothetical protein
MHNRYVLTHKEKLAEVLRLFLSLGLHFSILTHPLFPITIHFRYVLTHKEKLAEVAHADGSELATSYYGTVDWLPLAARDFTVGGAGALVTFICVLFCATA